MQESPGQSGRMRAEYAPAGESPWSLLLAVLIFGYAGFMLVWSTHPAAQMAMWSLRVLAVAFALTIAVALAAPRAGAWLRLAVVALAAALLLVSGGWMLAVNGAGDLFAWLLIIMGLFDAAEVWRCVAQRRYGQRRASAAYWDAGESSGGRG